MMPVAVGRHQYHETAISPDGRGGNPKSAHTALPEHVANCLLDLSAFFRDAELLLQRLREFAERRSTCSPSITEGPICKYSV